MGVRHGSLEESDSGVGERARSYQNYRALSGAVEGIESPFADIIKEILV